LSEATDPAPEQLERELAETNRAAKNVWSGWLPRQDLRLLSPREIAAELGSATLVGSSGDGGSRKATAP
jgi:hypothetical protein